MRATILALVGHAPLHGPLYPGRHRSRLSTADWRLFGGSLEMNQQAPICGNIARQVARLTATRLACRLPRALLAGHFDRYHR
jgi:hypothetical protein